VAGRPQAQQLMIDMCVRFFFSFFFSFYILFSLMILGSGRIYGTLILRFFFLFFLLPFFAVGYCSSGLLGVKLSTEGSENAN